MHTTEKALEENRHLRRTMRDLVALSTLPAVWTGLSPEGIVRSLADVLLNTLSLDLLYVRLEGLTGGGVVEVVRNKHGLDAARVETVKASLASLLGADRSDPPSTIPDPFGAGTLHIAVTRFGIADDNGVLIAGSRHADFPSERDRLLLSVGANQTAIVLQRSRAGEQIREQQERLRVTLACIGDGVIATDTAGRITTMNAVAESLTGWTKEEATGQTLDTVFRIVNEQTRQPVPNPTIRAIREGVIVGLANHTVLIAKDGTERSIDDSAAPIRSKEGHIVGCVLVFRDVTEQRRLEKQKIEQGAAARRLAAIVDSSEDAIVSKTLDGIIQSWNTAAEKIFGYTAEEAVGRPITMLFPADRLDEEDKIIVRIRTGERIEHFDTLRLRKDGTTVPISLTISPVKDEEGRIIGASKIARDITERKEAEERLRLLSEAAAVVLYAPDSNALMRTLFAKISPIIGADIYLNYIVNETGDGLRLASYVGIPEEAVRNITRMDFGEMISGTVALHRQPFAASFVQQSDDPKVQLAKSFGIRAYTCNPLMAGNLLLGTLAFASRSKDEFDTGEVEFLETICHYVTGAYERLWLMERLRQADHKKDEFLATLAHELRNPLAPVRTGLQLIQMAGGKVEEIEKARTMMERQVAQIVRLVDDLMDLTRISRGKIELKKQPVELAVVVNNAVETARPLIKEMGHELIVLLPEQPITVNADLTRLAQVFSNLLTNAAKYTDMGGRIWLTAERQGSDVVVTVKDTGIGIPADKLRSIFEMFSQVEGALSRSQGGLGIGLCLVNQLVQMHGGSIEAESEGPGRGSRFVVRLPITVEQHDAITTSDNGESAMATSKLRILVVDDNRDAAESLAILLKIMGNNVRTASDGEKGVQAAGEFRPHIVLLDIGLPKLNGYEACRRIRQQAGSKDMVLIAVTGWGAEEDRRKSEEAGFDHHMVKPVDPTSLMKLLADLNMVKA
jgi:PAS domain S-box-containing protein